MFACLFVCLLVLFRFLATGKTKKDSEKSDGKIGQTGSWEFLFKRALDQTKKSTREYFRREISAEIHAVGQVKETENTCQKNGKDGTKRESDFFTMFEVAAGLHAEYTPVECITRTLQSSHKHEHVMLVGG